jgi:hypothetical protein
LLRLIGVCLSLACTACRGCDAARSVEDGTEAPVIAQSCEEARRFPESVPTNDVRFLDCDQPAGRTGEAFELGLPVPDPDVGPPPTDPGLYKPGHCDHRNGAIAEYGVYYDDIAVAIECSRLRCKEGDARGCADLGALYSSDTLPGVRKNEERAFFAFSRACDLGHGGACLDLASIYEARGDDAEKERTLREACLASPPAVTACAALGQLLIERGHAAGAKPYLMRGCRGTTFLPSPFAAFRQGCGKLAELAAARGDTASEREYLRLECAYGSAGPFACARLGEIMVATGNRQKARAYLRRACEASIRAPEVFAKQCQVLEQLDSERGK